MKFRKNINSDKVTLQQQSFIFSTISELMKFGFSISQALDFIKTVSKESQNNLKVEQGLKGGYPLPKSMKFFKQFNVSTIINC